MGAAIQGAEGQTPHLEELCRRCEEDLLIYFRNYLDAFGDFAGKCTIVAAYIALCLRDGDRRPIRVCAWSHLDATKEFVNVLTAAEDTPPTARPTTISVWCRGS